MRGAESSTVGGVSAQAATMEVAARTPIGAGGTMCPVEAVFPSIWHEQGVLSFGIGGNCGGRAAVACGARMTVAR